MSKTIHGSRNIATADAQNVTRPVPSAGDRPRGMSAADREARKRYYLSLYRDDDNGCWVYLGPEWRDGYGRAGTGRFAHRLFYEERVGPIPAGFHVDHLCRNHGCVNPAHLEAVPPRVNILRGVGVAAANARKTHCKHGHEFTPENTRTSQVHKNGRTKRECRTCVRVTTAAAKRAYRERQKAKAAS